MKSRLDEIVEEYAFSNDPDDKKLALEIAERAFRHGVEQAQAAVYVDDNAKWLGGNRMEVSIKCPCVQPAPAEEKVWKHPYKPPVGVCQIPGCTDPPFEHPCDRRKGERRKGIEHRTGFVVRPTGEAGPLIRIYQPIGEGAAWYRDRRFGKDRRKP